LTIFERYVEGYNEAVDLKDFCLLACVCACVREGEERQIRERETKGAFKNRLNSST
jgi:hypothetical protein